MTSYSSTMSPGETRLGPSFPALSYQAHKPLRPQPDGYSARSRTRDDLSFLRGELELMILQGHELTACTEVVLAQRPEEPEVERNVLHLKAKLQALLFQLEEAAGIAAKAREYASPDPGASFRRRSVNGHTVVRV